MGLGVGVRNGDVPRQNFAPGPWKKCCSIRSFAILSYQTGRFFDSWYLRPSYWSPQNVVHVAMTLLSGCTPATSYYYYYRYFDFTLKFGTFGVPGWSCRDAGQHGTNPGHPGKSGTGGNPTAELRATEALLSLTGRVIRPFCRKVVGICIERPFSRIVCISFHTHRK